MANERGDLCQQRSNAVVRPAAQREKADELREPDYQRTKSLRGSPLKRVADLRAR